MSNTMITTNTNATEFTAVQTIPAEMKSNEVASKAPVILDANSTEMPSNETVSSEAVVVEANPTAWLVRNWQKAGKGSHLMIFVQNENGLPPRQSFVIRQTIGSRLN